MADMDVGDRESVDVVSSPLVAGGPHQLGDDICVEDRDQRVPSSGADSTSRCNELGERIARTIVRTSWNIGFIACDISQFVTDHRGKPNGGSIYPQCLSQNLANLQRRSSPPRDD